MHTRHHTLSAYLPDETATLAAGEMLAGAVRSGLTAYLLGDLGAGKTTLVRGILRGLGYAGRVKSPTYTLVEPYVISSLYLHHFDLYRFANPMEWEDAGFREMFNPTSVCFVEWPDKAAGLLPSPDWTIALSDEGVGRRLLVSANSTSGEEWLANLTDLDMTLPGG